MYRTLNAAFIVTTQETLARRIHERFPESGLCKVAEELLGIASATDGRLRRIRRPHWLLRIGVGLLIVAFVATAAATFAAAMLQVSVRFEDLGELLQGLEAGTNEVILLSLAIFFLLSLETRLKRRQALLRLHELRSVAHVIDMHQLTKDPESVLSTPMPTPSSPKRTMTRFELSRYLDYCSELLAVISKLAALHAQYLRDPVILDAVNDVETLTNGLSYKIWQKIIILDAESSTPLPIAVAPKAANADQGGGQTAKPI